MTHFIARLIQISFMVLFLICLTKKSNILQKYNNVCLSFSWQQLCPEWCLFPQENFWTKNFSSPVGWSPVAKWQKGIKIPADSFHINKLNQNCLFSDIEYRKPLLWFEKVSRIFGNDLPVFNVTEQTVLFQAVYVKRDRWGSLYVSYTTLEGGWEEKKVHKVQADNLSKNNSE